MEEPEITDGLNMYWNAWQTLRYDRAFGDMGGQYPIPFTAMDRYARRYGIEGMWFDLLRQYLSEMDSEYLAVVAERRAEEDARRKAEQGNR